MDLGLLASIIVVLCGLVVGYNFAGRGAQALGGLFHPPGLGWPSGVQEDDDFAWRWGASQARAEPPGPSLVAVGPTSDGSPPMVGVERIHGSVHRR